MTDVKCGEVYPAKQRGIETSKAEDKVVNLPNRLNFCRAGKLFAGHINFLASMVALALLVLWRNWFGEVLA